MTYPTFPFTFFLALQQVLSGGLIRIFQGEECRLLMVLSHKDDLRVISSEIHQILWLFIGVLWFNRNDLCFCGLSLQGGCNLGGSDVRQSDLLDFLHEIEEILGRVPKVDKLLQLLHSEIIHLLEHGVKVSVQALLSRFKDPPQLLDRKRFVFLLMNGLAMYQLTQNVEPLMMRQLFDRVSFRGMFIALFGLRSFSRLLWWSYTYRAIVPNGYSNLLGEIWILIEVSGHNLDRSPWRRRGRLV